MTDVARMHIVVAVVRLEEMVIAEVAVILPRNGIPEGDIVRTSDSLTDVVNKFRVGERYNLIVIDNQNNYIGVISRANTFSAYRRFISETSDE